MSIRSRVHEHSGLMARLRRYPRQGWVAGVCAGLAEYFDWNAKLLRVLFALAFIFGGFFPAGLIYCVLWYLMDAGDRRPRVEAAADDDTDRRYGSAPAGPSDPRERFARLEARLRSMEEVVTSNDFELRREFRKLQG